MFQLCLTPPGSRKGRSQPLHICPQSDLKRDCVLAGLSKSMYEESWEDVRPAADVPQRGRLLHLHTKCIASAWHWTISLPLLAVLTPLRFKIYSYALPLGNLAHARVDNPKYLVAGSVKTPRHFMRHGGSEKPVGASHPLPWSQAEYMRSTPPPRGHLSG